MSIKVACPGCDRKLTAPDGAAGKTVRCPKCNTRLTMPGGAKRQAPQRKTNGSGQTTPTAPFVDDLAAAFFMKGEGTPPRLPALTDLPEEEADDGSSPHSQAGFDAQHSQDARWTKCRFCEESAVPAGAAVCMKCGLDLRTGQKPFPAKRSSKKGLLIRVTGGLAAIILLAVAFFVYRSHATAEADGQAQQAAVQQHAQQQAEQESVRKAQLAHQQQLEQTALGEKRRREEAERRISQLEGEQKRQAELEFAHQEQLAKEENERKQSEKSAADEKSSHQNEWLSMLKKMAEIEQHMNKAGESYNKAQAINDNVHIDDPQDVRNALELALPLWHEARSEVDTALQEMDELRSSINQILIRETSINSAYKDAWAALLELADAGIEKWKVQKKLVNFELEYHGAAGGRAYGRDYQRADERMGEANAELLRVQKRVFGD